MKNHFLPRFRCVIFLTVVMAVGGRLLMPVAYGQATGAGASVGGNNNIASGTAATAFGNGNISDHEDTVALGYSNTASSGPVSPPKTVAGQSSAVGVFNQATAKSATAVGKSNTASDWYASAVGFRNNAFGKSSSAIGSHNWASAWRSVAIGRTNWATGDSSVALGRENSSEGAEAVAIGRKNQVFAAGSFAAGVENRANGSFSLAVGSGNTIGSSDIDGVAFGRNNHAGTEALADGIGNIALGDHSLCMGAYNTSYATYASCFGRSLINDIPNSLMIGPSDSAKVTILSNGNVGVGTTSPGTYKLAVNGTLRAKQVIIDTGWSDYVFDPDYRLAPLAEVEKQIKAERHLPGIPSASDVAAKGISVGEMQARLLAKIEELTLHQIEQEKRLVAATVQLSQQSERIEHLEAENARLKLR